jgi:hypothetical protein
MRIPVSCRLSVIGYQLSEGSPRNEDLPIDWSKSRPTLLILRALCARLFLDSGNPDNLFNSYLEKQQRNLRRSRRSPLPEPASITNLQRFVTDAG